MCELAVKPDARCVCLATSLIKIREVSDKVAFVVAIDNDAPFLDTRFPADTLDPGFTFGC